MMSVMCGIESASSLLFRQLAGSIYVFMNKRRASPYVMLVRPFRAESSIANIRQH
jgi:hypothetical protein